jgi:hypothetical protein
MVQRNWKAARNLMFGLLTVLLVTMIAVAILTYTHRDAQFSNPLIMFAIMHHIELMIFLALISIGFGFFWANMSYTEVRQTTIDSKGVLEVVLMFLSREEKEIVNFLVSHKGETTQAEISRLASMGRVKAFRSLSKMQQKGIIEIIPHGKIRKVKLKDNILHIINKK